MSASPAPASPTAGGHHGGATVGVVPTMTVADVIDTLTYDDTASPRLRKMVFEMQGWVQNTDFAEDFLDRDGLATLLRALKVAGGSLQGHLLQVVKGLLVYVNAIEQVAESPDLVEKIYALLIPPADGSPVNLTVARSVLELLIVICGVMPQGHQLVNDAAKKKAGIDGQPYAVLVPLLGAADLLTVRTALTFMNILMSKRKAVDDLKAKNLLFRFKESGVLALLKPLSIVDDDGVKQQLAVFQRIANFTIPRSWEEAQKFKTLYEEMRRRYDQANESLFVYQQQQAKVRLMKLELAKAQETIKALTVAMPGSSAMPHPTKRFTQGGGIPLSALTSPQIEPVDVNTAASDVSQARKLLLDRIMESGDMRSLAEKMLAPSIARKLESQGYFKGGGGKSGGHGRRAFDPAGGLDDDDDDGPPPDDDDDGPPPDDDDDGPPPEEDDGQPPSSDAPKAGKAVKGGTTGSAPAGPESSGAGAAPDSAAVAGGQGTISSTGQAPLGEAAVGVVSTAAAATTAVVGTSGAPPPPPPPPPGRPGGPPPPPPRFGAAAGGSAAAKDTRVFYRGPPPSKKMRPLHWDKVNVDPADTHSMWAKIFAGAVPSEFDYGEFETMFSHKEVDSKKDEEAEAEKSKPKKIILIDSRIFQNISIMLHKLPSIPTILRALTELDAESLKRDMLASMIGQTPAPDVRKQFVQQQNLKPVEEYEPPEQFVALAISIPEFKRRCQAWLFSMEWAESIASATQPVTKMHEAVKAILASQHLPVYFALLLGFGNMMNHGNALKGNAGAISVTTLSKLDASKDNRGRVSLLQHLLTTVKAKYPTALDVHEELKPILNGVATLKMDEVEKAVQEAEKALETFTSQCNAVRKALAEQGSNPDDQFAPRMAEFQLQAQKDVDAVKLLYGAFKESFAELLKYFGIPPTKPVKLEEILVELVPFVEKIRKEAVELDKERKRQQRKGQRIDSAISNVVGRLQEQMVSA